MEGPAHGSIVAGVSSTFVAGYLRKHVHDTYDPDTDPPSVSERLSNRAPLAFAGLGFTGLSTAVAYNFDSLEKRILGDADGDIPLHQQGGVHRELHALPYIGTVWGAAHLTLHSTERFGEWIALKLQVPDLAEEIATHLNDLAEWIVAGNCFGVVGHLLGDLPTKGQGGTALRLLAPITDRNFAQGWLSASNQVANAYFTKAGILLAGAAWTVSGAYLVSWKPPERHLSEYARILTECESFTEAVATVSRDIDHVFDSITSGSVEEFWDRPLFESPFEDLHPAIDRHWFHQQIDPERVFDVESYAPAVLVQEGIWPERVDTTTTWTPLISDESSEGIPSVLG